MLQSELFYKTFKSAPKEAETISHKLLLRGGFISQLASGLYSFLPLGRRVHKKIEEIIREEINAIGGQELFLPSLQPKEIWLKTDRWAHMDPPLFKIKDRHEKEFALGSTHEEVITDLVKDYVQSYKDLPRALYQIQTKFRNEMRFAGGLLRTREFVMKDLYSFHRDENDLDKFFNKVLTAYDKIFKRCGLDALKSEASGGVFTKDKTYEFQVLSAAGEDRIINCPKCKWTANLEVSQLKENDSCPMCKGKLVKASSIELGHTFRLGSKYSKSFGLNFLSKNGKKEPVIMGCYGIGVGRLMGAIVEIHNDERGIIWPEETAPFRVHLIQIESSPKVTKEAEKIYQNLSALGGSTSGGQKKCVEVLYDDRQDKTAGEKFAEADLLGIPYRIVVSAKTMEQDKCELKERTKKEVKLIKASQLEKIFYAG